MRPGERADEVYIIAMEQARNHEAWILAFGLGLRPIELRRLQRILGEPMASKLDPESTDVYRVKGVSLDRAAVQWAVRTTTDVIFRLWLSESLAPRPWPWLDEEEEDED